MKRWAVCEDKIKISKRNTPNSWNVCRKVKQTDYIKNTSLKYIIKKKRNPPPCTHHSTSFASPPGTTGRGGFFLYTDTLATGQLGEFNSIKKGYTYWKFELGFSFQIFSYATNSSKQFRTSVLTYNQRSSPIPKQKQNRWKAQNRTEEGAQEGSL